MKHKIFVSSSSRNESKETLHESLHDWEDCIISHMGEGFGDGVVMEVTDEQEKAIIARGFGVRDDISE